MDNNLGVTAVFLILALFFLFDFALDANEQDQKPKDIMVSKAMCEVYKEEYGNATKCEHGIVRRVRVFTPFFSDEYTVRFMDKDDHDKLVKVSIPKTLILSIIKDQH